MDTQPHLEHHHSFWRSPLLFWLVVIALLFCFLSAVSAILLPFVLGMLLAYCFDPVADRMERIGFSRTAATAVITVLLFAGIIGALLWLVPIIARQLAGLVSLVPEAITRFEHFADQVVKPLTQVVPGLDADSPHGGLEQAIHNLSQELLGSPGEFVNTILASGAKIVNVLSLLFITPIVSFYALRDWDKMKHKADTLLPLEYEPAIRTQCREIDRTLAGFLRGQLNVMLILAVYYCVALSIIGVPFAIVIGILTALLIIVPYVGTLLSVAMAAGSAWLDTGVGNEFYAVLAVYAIGHIAEQQILTPKIVGDKVGLHPLWMLFAILSGAALFGFAGVLIAVPVAAVIGVVVRFAVARYLSSAYYLGEEKETVLL